MAEALFNVSLIYKDLDDLASAIQCCRGSCRVYEAVLGHVHKDTRDAEQHLDQLSADYRHNVLGTSGESEGAGFCGFFGSSSSKRVEGEASHDLSANPKLRMAFRTVLEEVRAATHRPFGVLVLTNHLIRLDQPGCASERPEQSQRRRQRGRAGGKLCVVVPADRICGGAAASTP